MRLFKRNTQVADFKYIRGTSCLFLLICWLMLKILTIPCAAQDKMRGPGKSKIKTTIQWYGQAENFYINFYQNWISPVKGGNTCPMFPACSQYAKIAFLQSPWHQAYINSLERLLRCGNDLHFYPAIIIDKQIRWYDPVETDSIKSKRIFDD